MKEKLIAFIKDRLGYQVIDIDKPFDSIGVDGLDAETFFIDFEKEFDIDMTGFEFDRYFLGENPFIKTLGNTIKYWGKKKRFSFNHLIKVAERGKWFDP
ncbi:DUF1493 family protein [Flagellimonas hadalis]|uniref:DUF1493 family protein n=1 Tax=Flagellimonas hadalis TaxID=2597517 RepID=A0A5N5IV59_9FLAO|nr:DUF1493 family protein [Allomuricauda hadalis]KAB5492154.1 DUF1493 family protein [Allomuricauda hadalis]